MRNDLDYIVGDAPEPPTSQSRNGVGAYDAPPAAVDMLRELVEIERSKAWRPTPTNRPPLTEAVLSIGGNRLGSPGNLTLVISSPGTGKSNVCTATMAAAIAALQGRSIDSLGIAVHASRATYIDAERDRADSWDGHDAMKKRAGIPQEDDLPDGFDYILFTEIPTVKERREELEKLIEARPELLIIDGLGDFVGSVNDEEACSEFLSWLRAKAGEYRIAVLATLHDNPTPGASKARGHMGSEAMRRAEAVLYLQRDEESGIRTLTTKFAHGKVRSGSDRVETSFVWDDEKRMHVSCDSPTPLTVKDMALRGLVEAVYGDDTFRTYTELWRAIQKHLGTSDRTAKGRVKVLADEGLIMKDGRNYIRVALILPDAEDSATVGAGEW